jgi:hypothetical protein
MKYRKPVSVILIAAFALMTADCVTTRNVAAARLRPDEKDYRIVGILKKTGERIDVDKANPAYVAGDKIHINGALKVPAAGTTVVKTDGGFVITTDKGSSYETGSFGRDGDRLVFRTKSEIAIPLSDVSAVWTRENNTGMTVLAVVVGVAVAGGVLLAIAALSLKPVLIPIPWGF